jgi:hypothetical protein
LTFAKLNNGIGGRLLTLEDTVEWCNPILGVPLTRQEKQDLIVCLRALSGGAEGER